MEIMQFAINMELDGERFYREQAEKNAGNALGVVFRMLADEEDAHAKLLLGHANGQPFAPTEDGALHAQMSLFRKTGDWKTGATPDQAEIYADATAMEERSIRLYRDLLDQAQEDASRKLFDFLVLQEQGHASIMEDLYRYVNRPNEWVESAEFGVREEY